MIAYLDSSAFVKLVKEEAESATLRRELRRWPHRASSGLLKVEVLRAARVAGVEARAGAMLRDVTLVPVADPVLAAASRIEPANLRSLDAIHLATALSLEDDLGVLVTYDGRLADAARSAGAHVVAPA